MAVTGRNLGLKFMVGLLVGVIFSGMASLMILSGSINLQKFYDVGNIFDVSSAEYEKAADHWNYNYSTKVIEIDADTGSCFFTMPGGFQDWNYLYLDLVNVSKPAVRCQAAFCDRSGNVIYALDCSLQEGSNVLNLQQASKDLPPQERRINGFSLKVEGPSSFGISRLQLRERQQTFGPKEIVTKFAAVFACWVMILLFVVFKVPKAWRHKAVRRHSWLGSLQEAYRCLLCNAAGLFEEFSLRKISFLRRLLFLASLLIMYIMYVSGWRWQVLLQRRMVFLLGVCLLLVAFLSWEPQKRAVNWKNPLMYAWVALWVMCIISEFVVGKDVQHVGVFMLVCMGPLYLAWANMEKPDRLLNDFLVAMRWCYWLSCFFCLFFRAYTPGIRYMGIYQNPNSFAGYLATVNIAFLIWLDANLNKEKLKAWPLCKNVLALASICGLLALTESITSVVVYVMECVVFIWKQFPNEKPRRYRENLRAFLLMSVLAVAFTWVPGRLCLEHVPQILKTNVTFEGDAYLTREDPLSLPVQAAGGEQAGVGGRILSKIRTGDWDSLFSSRTDVWKAYFRELNLFGHRGYLKSLNGKKAHAHNALLQMMGYYGVFVAVPYLFLLYYSLKYGITVIFGQRCSGISLFFLMAAVNYIVLGLTEDMATPFFYIGWLTFFISLGGLTNQPAGTNVRR